MLFNTSVFGVFLALVFGLYWLFVSKNLHWRNAFLVVASYVFYGWWDPRFLFLIVISSVTDYFVGIQIEKNTSESRRKLWLSISLVSNLGILGFFKYFNFFIESFANLTNIFGIVANVHSLNIILPVGISFYTFQTLSYSIDVYKRKMPASTNILAFLAYVSFFPQLVAGPIERAERFLPQFLTIHVFEYARAKSGVRLIIWGLFKKVVIADNCAVLVNEVFSTYQELSGLELIMGAILFAFQIYGDFSGYSDIAIGIGRLFGFELMTNFRTPYFSRDVAEFWRRWHISLSTWFRDYVYIPLGGSRGSKWLSLRNTFIVFLVSGFWHGANWTFIAWGFIHALLFLPLLLTNSNRSHLGVVAEHSRMPSLKEIFQILSTFTLVTVAWVFFRAESISDAFTYLISILDSPFFGQQLAFSEVSYCIPILFLLIVEYLGRRSPFDQWLDTIPQRGFRTIIYYLLLLSIVLLGRFEQTAFIYFQF